MKKIFTITIFLLCCLALLATVVAQDSEISTTREGATSLPISPFEHYNDSIISSPSSTLTTIPPVVSTTYVQSAITTSAVSGVTTSLDSGVTTTIDDGRASQLTFITTTVYTTPTTTIYCGDDESVCYVEFDITGDREFECCTVENNPVCALCLPKCREFCDKRGEGVEFCFGTDLTFSCDCTRAMAPTCYQITTTTTTAVTTTYVGIIDATKANRSLFYLILLIIMLAVMAGLIYYVRSL